MASMPEHAHRHAEHRTPGLPRHWSRDGATTHDGVDPARCAECGGRDYVVCRECGAHFLTILREHDGLCFDCTEVPS